ncbi:hypothetical protein BC739_003606 [Kutzneria viridogrisea]|uniref:Uncharacterized protein n=1 Tax=Kutzneria viridogrisea TaxID=47990 RepID=A0ABR6BIC5_9PSEU|nr:hypothetical protein [Kutzneria viridogrisea]
MSNDELATIRDHQVRALRGAAPPWWYFTGFGLLIVASSLAREVHTAPWGLVGFAIMPIGLITLLLLLDRFRRVKVTLRGGRPWIMLALWAAACAALGGADYGVALLADLPYPETTATAIFAVLFAATGPAVSRRIHTSVVGRP